MSCSLSWLIVWPTLNQICCVVPLFNCMVFSSSSTLTNRIRLNFMFWCLNLCWGVFFSHVGIKQLVFGGKHLGDWDDDLTTGEDGLKSYKIWNYCMWLAAFLLQSQKWLADLETSAHRRYSHEDIHFLLQSQKWLADLEVSAHCRYSHEDIQTITSTCFWQ